MGRFFMAMGGAVGSIIEFYPFVYVSNILTAPRKAEGAFPLPRV
jgi:hypothetical protein